MIRALRQFIVLCLFALCGALAAHATAENAQSSEEASLEFLVTNDLPFLENMDMWKAQLNKPGSEGFTPLHWAAYLGRLNIARKLIDAGAIVDSRSVNDGKTPLHFAAQGQDYKMVELLINTGANVNVRDNLGFTPLHSASSSYYVELLASAGADVNARNNEQSTPLIIAVHFNRLQIVTALLKAGAYVNSRDRNGNTPLDWAEHVRNIPMADALIRAGGQKSR